MIKLLELGLCDQEGILRTFKIINILLQIAKILVPLIIIIAGSIDLFKVIMNGDSDDGKKVFSQFIRRIIAGLVVFMLPTLINYFMNLTTKYKETETAFAGCSSCLTNTKECDTLISVAQARANLESASAENHSLTPEEQALWNKKYQTYKGGKKPSSNSNSNNSGTNNSGTSNSGTNNGTTSSETSSSTPKETQTVGGGRYFDSNDVTKISGLTEEQFISVLQNSTAYKGKAKVYIPLAHDLILAEKNHGVNAFYLIGLYSYESGWLKSDLTKNCNNIGGVRFYNQSYGNGKKASNCGGYAGFDSIGEFIDFHANLLEVKYLTPGGKHYYGTSVANVAKDYGSSRGVDTIIQIATRVSS